MLYEFQLEALERPWNIHGQCMYVHGGPIDGRWMKNSQICQWFAENGMKATPSWVSKASKRVGRVRVFFYREPSVAHQAAVDRALERGSKWDTWGSIRPDFEAARKSVMAQWT